ncbi:MAG TPA: sigma 54-interacting transcriptional regulator [Syntrophorhabdaceae bacterium]|nr:sigma 54-interacting transcriptional regulator [Syntrophorhabdaceae bacterium]
MKTDENEFFREFTLRLCGSLELEKALWFSFLYVEEIMPADELILTVYDLGLGVLEVVATADAAGGVLRSGKTPMPPHLRRELEDVARYPRVRRSDDVLQDPIIALVAKHFDWPASSIIVARLIIEDQFIGSLIIRADGKGRYTGEHERLWTLVNEPAAIALTNSRRYRELLRLKDLLADDSRYFQDELRKNFGDEIVGANFGLKGVMDQVLRVAALSSPVLLLGETGTGKEVIANAIHNLSSRSRGPLIKVNCGAIPESLMDSELFGHEKGAFTGAFSQKRGRFERAQGGTVFLDEVAELPPQAQVRLLRVIQEKEIERVGGTEPIKVDIRIISATHRDITELVKAGSFREDLYYRLGVYPIHIPSLRDRKADIPALVEHFIREKTKEMGLTSLPTLAPGTIDLLMDYDWPGNVREVGNVVERALIQSGGGTISLDSIPNLKPASVRSVSNDVADSLTLDQVEARHIRRIMEQTGGKVEGEQGAALALGMNPGTLRHRMRKLGIPFGRPRKTPR